MIEPNSIPQDVIDVLKEVAARFEEENPQAQSHVIVAHLDTGKTLFFIHFDPQLQNEFELARQLSAIIATLVAPTIPSWDGSPLSRQEIGNRTATMMQDLAIYLAGYISLNVHIAQEDEEADLSAGGLLSDVTVDDLQNAMRRFLDEREDDP